MLLLLPTLIAFGAVILYPFLKALSLSLYEFTLRTPEPVFVGLANFAEVLTNDAIQSAFVTTFIYVGATTLFTMLLGLAWAIIVNQPFRGRAARGSGAVADALDAALDRDRLPLGLGVQQPLRHSQRPCSWSWAARASRPPGCRPPAAP